MPLKRIFNADGVTLIELVATMAILSILMTGIVPLSQVTYKRAKEIELKQNLRMIRTAIDSYKKMGDDGLIPKEALSSGYPESLEILVEGIPLKGPESKKMKFLRRIPRDPVTEDGEWGLRSYSDDSDSDIWGGQDVYDIYSKSDRKALDGSSYRNW
ncbi:MAG: type II secretion system GspH family protein [Proteobacteria bacterium]|nr:type II secretion system GspH family protein [Pseudomonadota bacterium]